MEAEVRERERERERGRFEDTALVALKGRKGSMSQGEWAPPEAGEGKEMDSPLEPPERCSPATILILDQ